MDKQEITKMKRRVRILQKQLGALGPVMRGSIVRIGTRNKQFLLLPQQGQENPSHLSWEQTGALRQGVLYQPPEAP